MPTEAEIEEAKRKADEEAARRAAEETSEDEETETEEEELTVDQLKAKLADSEKARRLANKEAKERRLKLEAIEKEKKEKEEADLSETAKAAKRAEEAEARALKAEKEAQDLKLKDKFRVTASDLKLEFASGKAEEDAFSHLKPEALEEEDLEEQLKQIVKDRPYLLKGSESTNKNIRDGSEKGKLNNVTVEKTILDKKRASSLLGPL